MLTSTLAGALGDAPTMANLLGRSFIGSMSKRSIISGWLLARRRSVRLVVCRAG